MVKLHVWNIQHLFIKESRRDVVNLEWNRKDGEARWLPESGGLGRYFCLE